MSQDAHESSLAGPLPLPGDLIALMNTAMADASKAEISGDVPVGALVIDRDGRILGTGRNERELHSDPTAHAELIALRAAAAAREEWRLADATLVVTLEPCVMCAGAILAARIPRVIFGAWDDKAGAAGSVYDILRDGRLNHTAEVVAGVEAEACAEQLRAFFAARR